VIVKCRLLEGLADDAGVGWDGMEWDGVFGGGGVSFKSWLVVYLMEWPFESPLESVLIFTRSLRLRITVGKARQC
jgi:hypothetical protein